MAKRLDQILVVDVESTCWEGEPPPGQQSEIIEIGLCPLEVASLRVVEKRSILVNPQHSQVSEFCTQLTTLTAQDLVAGIPFPEAVRLLKREYHSQQRLWASWGDYDRRQFERVCKLYRVGYPFGQSHLNVKTLFATAWGLPYEVGMPTALGKLDFPLEGTHHRGHDDAGNIARILAELLRRTRLPSGS